MSRKDNLPRSAFSLRYLATHELEVSLNSATAVAMLGSVLSMLIVVLTFFITSCVSFVYSSSEAANAAGITDSGVESAMMVDNDKKLRRWVVVVVVVTVVGWWWRIGRSGLWVVEEWFVVVGVTKVGDAMSEEEVRWLLFVGELIDRVVMLVWFDKDMGLIVLSGFHSLWLRKFVARFWCDVA